MPFFLISILVLFSVQAVATTELSSEWIKEQLPKVRTIDGLLERFTPSSLERHLLAYGSQSDQFSSFLSPRVIVYSYDADFIMAFNGEPESKGYYSLEMIRFNHGKKSFHPEIVHFDPKGIKEPYLDPNPKNCNGCHQKDFRPNWDPYFHWVGFYGSEDDNVNARGVQVDDRLSTGPENEKYAEYLAKKKLQIETKVGRYRFLPAHPAERPNNDFNHRVVCLNMKRMLRAFSDHPLSGQVWQYIKRSDLLFNELPATLTEKASRTFEQVRSESEKIMKDRIQWRIARHIELTGEKPKGRVLELMAKEVHSSNIMYDLNMTAGWRYVFEEIFKQPFRPYVTSRHLDYNMNLGAATSIISLWEGSKVDPETNRVVFSEEPQYKSDGYGYECPRSKSEFDLLEKPTITP